MKRKLKLFVWTNFCPDYTSGLAFAIAKDETEAKKIIIDKLDYDPYDWGYLEVKSIYRKTGFAVCGGD